MLSEPCDATMPGMAAKRPVGVRADIAAGVTIGTIFSGYFNSTIAAEAFVRIGIKPILDKLGTTVGVVDFGGGDGFLMAQVRDYLLAHEREVEALVIDMNKTYLSRAEQRGLQTKTANVEDVSLDPQNLIIGRAVLHYNPLAAQQRIYNNVYRCLKSGGYFVHAPSSGDPANCALRTDIAALPSLGRTQGDGSVMFVVPGAHIAMAERAGFNSTELVGFAPGSAWTLSEMFARFNPAPAVEDAAYRGRKQQFIHDALALVERYQTTTNIQGIEIFDEDARITYQYPVFISYKE